MIKYSLIFLCLLSATIKMQAQRSVMTDSSGNMVAPARLTGGSFGITNGSIVAPSLYFSSQTNSGIYWAGTGETGWHLVQESSVMLSMRGSYIHGTNLVIRGSGGFSTYNSDINSRVYFLQGTGSPEGAVSANVGSYFGRSVDGSGNTAAYIKTSGTGNTGWSPIAIINTNSQSFANLRITSTLTNEGPGVFLAGQTVSGESTFEELSVTTLSVQTGVAFNGGGLKHGRITTGSINASSSALVVFSFTGVAFPDTNYTATVSVQDPTTAAASLRIVHIEEKTTTNVHVRVENTSAGALTGELNVIAMHD